MPPRQPKGLDVPDEPAILLKREVAEMIANQIKRIEIQRMEMEIVRVANGHHVDHEIPGMEPLTYNERLSVMSKQQQRVRDGFPSDVVTMAEQLLTEQHDAA